MNTRMFGVFVLVCVCFGVLVGGCTPEAKMSSQDKKDFKGGPMPPEAAAGMAKAMQESAQRAKQNATPTPVAK